MMKAFPKTHTHAHTRNYRRKVMVHVTLLTWWNTVI